MALALTIGISFVLIVLGLVGYLRDVRRGLMARRGALGGAILVRFWGAQWGAALAGRLVAGDPQRTTLLVNCLVFLWSALVVGYGGGVLLGRTRERPMSQRLVGGLLGLINGVLIVGFLLRYITEKRPEIAAAVQANLAANSINVGLPWLFLGAAIAITILALVRGAIGLFSRPPARTTLPGGSAPAQRPPAASSATAAPRVDKQREALDKVNDALRQQGR